MRRILSILKAKVLNRPLALCDIGDFDGIASAVLFLRKFNNGIVILAAPREVKKWWIRNTFWIFVADLPCPGKVYIRADHHITNKPCAKIEFYDPTAPCSAYLTMKALNLENDIIANEIVKIAIETDTANIVSEEAKIIENIVRYSSYSEKLYIIKKLAFEGLKALNDEKFKELYNRCIEKNQIIQNLVNKLPVNEILIIYSPKSLGISYRLLTIELEKKGVNFVNILVRRGFRTYRLYCGAKRDSNYDCTKIALKLGGGGHKFAAGAEFKSSIFKPSEGLKKFISVLKEELKSSTLTIHIIHENLEIKTLTL